MSQFCKDCNKKLSKPRYIRCMKCAGIFKRGITLIEKICRNCGNKFGVHPCYIKRGINCNIYCSKRCRAKGIYSLNINFIKVAKVRMSNQSGDKNINWKGGITLEHRAIRTSSIYRKWRAEIFKRDNYKCILCGISGNLQADHIKSFALYPDLRLDLNNGRTLCLSCHKRTDNYGFRRMNL